MTAKWLNTIGWMSVLAGLVAAAAARATDRNPADYVGVSTCIMCHKAAKVGNQVARWQDGPHSKAFEVLGSPAAKTVADKLGVANPQANGKCLKCHATAYNWTEQLATRTVKVEEGVVCESCHGPARNYVSRNTEELTLTEPGHPAGLAELFNPFARPSRICLCLFTMEERQKAITAGLVYPAFQSCARCHNDQSPAWKPDRHTTTEGKHVGFDISQNFARIAHPTPPPR